MDEVKDPFDAATSFIVGAALGIIMFFLILWEQISWALVAWGIDW